MNLWSSILFICTFVDNIILLEAVKVKPINCKLDQLQLKNINDSKILCTDGWNNVLHASEPTYELPTQTTCIYRCEGSNIKAWSFCQGGVWIHDDNHCITPSMPITKRVKTKEITRRKRGLFRRIVCAFSRCRRPQPPIPPDETKPHFNVPILKPVLADRGRNTQKVSFTEPKTASDNRDGTVSVKREGPYGPGSVFPEGRTEIKYTARDRSGNTLVKSMYVTVTVIRCPNHQPVKDGYVICDGTADKVRGTTCTFGCYMGHTLVGVQKTVCSDGGYWTGYTNTPPYCTKSSCQPLLATSAHLDVSCSDEFRFRSKCQFYCDTGFDLLRTVPRISVCQATLQWWGEINPICYDVDRPVFSKCQTYETIYVPRNKDTVSVAWALPEVTDNVDITLTPVHVSGPDIGDVLKAGTYVTVYGAKDSANNEATACRIYIVVKEIHCHEVYPLPLTTVDCTGTRWGSRCNFQCSSDGTALNGTSSATCEREADNSYGTWTWGNTQPYCYYEETCGDPEPPANGAFACDVWLGGLVCQMLCQSGYNWGQRQEIHTHLTCLQSTGEWMNQDFFPTKCYADSSNYASTLKKEFYFYFDGNCSVDNEDVTTEIGMNFLKFLTDDIGFPCKPEDGCRYSNVKIFCGDVDNSRRKRDIQNEKLLVKIDFLLENGSLNGDTALDLALKMAELESFLLSVTTNGTLQITIGNVTFIANIMTSSNIEIICPNNTVADYSSFRCVECQAGTYYNDSAHACVECPLGSYQHSSGQDTCTLCPLGYSTSYRGAIFVNECKVGCTPGSSSDSTLPPCTPCSIGTYQDMFGQTSCHACAAGRTTLFGSSVSSLNCSEFDIVLPDHIAGVAVNLTVQEDVDRFAVSFRAQCSNCTGHLFASYGQYNIELVLDHSNGIRVLVNSLLILTFDDFFPEDDIWYSYLLMYDNNVLTLTIDGYEHKVDCNLTMGSGSIVIGKSFKGSLSQLNIWNGEQIAYLLGVYTYCSLDGEGGILGWKSFGTSILNEAFLRIPSVCDDVNECLSNPCLHGNCTDLYQTYACDCLPGFTGTACEVDINECERNSCQNNATCQDGINEAICQCSALFTGVYCETAMIDGEWGSWSNWSMCSVTCGNGSLIRERTCDNPMPDNGGEDCPGNSSETTSCEMEQCPECASLTPPEHVLFDCTNDENITICTLDCEDGYDFDHVIRNQFECGKDTNYKWNFMSGGYELSDLPACQEMQSAITMKAERTVAYDNLDCQQHILSDLESAILNRVQPALQTITCMTDNNCTLSSLSVNGCSNRQRRDTNNSTLVGYSLVLDCNTANFRSEGCYAILSDAMTELSNNEELGLFNVNISRNVYTVHTNTTTAILVITCADGYVDVFAYCVPCANGSYYTNNECTMCAVGYYQNEAGQTSCKKCPTGRTTTGIGSKLEAHCHVTAVVDMSSLEKGSLVLFAIILGVIFGIIVLLLIAIPAFWRYYRSYTLKKQDTEILSQYPCKQDTTYKKTMASRPQFWKEKLQSAWT